MDTNSAQDASTQKEPLEAGSSVAEFATVIMVLIVVVCAAAALLLATQGTIEAAVSPPACAVHESDGALP